MTRRATLSGLAVVACLAASAAFQPTPPPPTVDVWKSPTCGCCASWIVHLRANGFQVVVHDTGDLAGVMAARGVPAALASCHTGTVGGYVIEGHVPADLIQRMLREHPAIRGLAVPGMPASSPGMDMGHTPYDVLTFDRAGRTTVYAHR